MTSMVCASTVSSPASGPLSWMTRDRAASSGTRPCRIWESNRRWGEEPHVLGLHLAPLVHDVGHGHVVQHPARPAHNGHPGVGLDGQVEVGREPEGPDGQHVVALQGLVRDARETYLARGEVLEPVVGVAHLGNPGAGRGQGNVALGLQGLQQPGGEPGHGLLGMGGVVRVGREEHVAGLALVEARPWPGRRRRPVPWGNGA